MTYETLFPPTRERFTPGRWGVDRTASRAAFTVAHHVLSRVRGEVPIADAYVDVDTAGRPVAMTARLDSAGFTTGHAKRDGHVRGHVYLQADRWPHLTFATDRVEPAPDGWSAHGTLTVRDVTIPLVLHVTHHRRSGAAVNAVATGTFDRFEAGLTAWPTIAVGRRVELHITAVLHPPTPADGATDTPTSTSTSPTTSTTRSAS